MAEERGPEGDVLDIGAYCRDVEAHLARVNEGHIIRVVGPGFELVRRWAIEGIPLSVVRHGIDVKSERHRAGRSKRPLRLEFCEVDVQAVYADWKRAVGLMTGAAATPAADVGPADAEERRRPSLLKHVERVIDRLVKVSGHLEWPASFRDAIGAAIDELVVIRDGAKAARGAKRDEWTHRLTAVDGRVVAAAADAVGPDVLASLRASAAAELASFSGRLAPAAWQRSVDLGADRLLREHVGLPTIELS